MLEEEEDSGDLQDFQVHQIFSTVLLRHSEISTRLGTGSQLSWGVVFSTWTPVHP